MPKWLWQGLAVGAVAFVVVKVAQNSVQVNKLKTTINNNVTATAGVRG